MFKSKSVPNSILQSAPRPTNMAATDYWCPTDTLLKYVCIPGFGHSNALSTYKGSCVPWCTKITHDVYAKLGFDLFLSSFQVSQFAHQLTSCLSWPQFLAQILDYFCNRKQIHTHLRSSSISIHSFTPWGNWANLCISMFLEGANLYRHWGEHENATPLFFKCNLFIYR